MPPFQVKHSPWLFYFWTQTAGHIVTAMNTPLPGWAKATSCLPNAVCCNGVLLHPGTKLSLMCDICKLYLNDIIFCK